MFLEGVIRSNEISKIVEKNKLTGGNLPPSVISKNSTKIFILKKFLFKK